MAAQNPATGGFTYMTPMMSGAARGYSQPERGRVLVLRRLGHGKPRQARDSIYWEGADTLFVNLYIPATMVWQDKGVTATLDTDYPFRPEVRLHARCGEAGCFALALRIPAWADGKATWRSMDCRWRWPRPAAMPWSTARGRRATWSR
jgi:DUF1680 family protein